MNLDPKKVIYLAIGLLAVFASFMLLSFFASFQEVFATPGALSNASPIGILAVFAILVFGAIFLFNAATHIIKGAM